MPRPSGRDLRAYARSTQLRLILGGLVVLALVGDGMIWIFYGSRPAALGLLCMALGLVPAVLIFVMLSLIDWITRRARGN